MRTLLGRGEPRRMVFAVLAAAVALAAGAPAAYGQCALCGQGTRYAGTDPARAVATFLAATLVLLLPTLGIVTWIGRMLWKERWR